MVFFADMASGGVDSVAQFLTVLVIFVFVLLIVKYTLRWAGKIQKMTSSNRNFEVIETCKVTSNKYLQIVRAGDKYLVIAIGKDEITMLTELDKDKLDFSGLEGSTTSDSFQKLFDKAKNRMQKRDSE